jgi:hypothetical protein
MLKAISSFLASVGISALASAQLPQKTELIDPKSVLFSVSTISDDLPTLEPIDARNATSKLVINEDDWTQVEFLPRSLLEDVKRMLRELSEFERANRVGVGWKNVYVRRFNRLAIIGGRDASKQIENSLGVARTAAPTLASVGRPAGRVKDGFSFSIGGNIALYGIETPNGVPVLGASVGEKPDDLKLTQAFVALNKKYGLILVDWRSKLILHGTTSRGQIEVWRP